MTEVIFSNSTKHRCTSLKKDRNYHFKKKTIIYGHMHCIVRPWDTIALDGPDQCSAAQTDPCGLNDVGPGRKKRK